MTTYVLSHHNIAYEVSKKLPKRMKRYFWSCGTG